MPIDTAHPMHSADAAAVRLHDVLDQCASGRLPANVALMQAIGAAGSPDEFERAAHRAVAGSTGVEADRLQHLVALWQQSPNAWQTVRAVLAEVDRSPLTAARPASEGFAELFDRLAEVAPDAASALYALGRPDILDAATASIVETLAHWGLLGRDRDVLDLGCGAGRVSLAVAEHVRSVAGIDVSRAMLALARSRRKAANNVTFHLTDGSSLTGFGDACFDLVTAVDVFPYLVAGEDTSARHIQECARVLRPGGALVIFNFSYTLALVEQCRLVDERATGARMSVVRSGTRDLRWWDGVTFHLVKAA